MSDRKVIYLNAGIKILSEQDGMIECSNGDRYNKNYYDVREKGKGSATTGNNKQDTVSSNKKGTYPKHGVKSIPKGMENKNWEKIDGKYYLFSTLPKDVRSEIADRKAEEFNKQVDNKVPVEDEVPVKTTDLGERIMKLIDKVRSSTVSQQVTNHALQHQLKLNRNK